MILEGKNVEPTTPKFVELMFWSPLQNVA